MWLNIDREWIERSLPLLQQSQMDPFKELAATIQERLVPSDVDNKYIEAARAVAREGDLEFDDEPVVSIGSDPGAYVMAWKWIPDANAGVTEEEEEEEETTDAAHNLG